MGALAAVYIVLFAFFKLLRLGLVLQLDWWIHGGAAADRDHHLPEDWRWWWR